MTTTSRCSATPCPDPNPNPNPNPHQVLPDPGSMRVGAIKAELETRGVPTAALLEKAELVEALREARRRA